MATPLTKVYDSFESKILEDEWGDWTIEDIRADEFQILCAAIPWFKFPRSSLEFDETQENFLGDLDNKEIQLLSTYMKCEWIDRTITSWENLKPLYDERDFSQANLIDKFREKLKDEREVAYWQESNYYRSRDGKPFDFSKMAGGVQ